MHCNYWKPGCPGAHALQQEEPPQWEVHGPQRRAAPAHHKERELAQSSEDPSTQKQIQLFKKNFFKEVKWGHALIFLPPFLPLALFLSPFLVFLPSSVPLSFPSLSLPLFLFLSVGWIQAVSRWRCADGYGHHSHSICSLKGLCFSSPTPNCVPWFKKDTVTMKKLMLQVVNTCVP